MLKKLLPMLLVPLSVLAIETKPWYDPGLELQLRGIYRFQHYRDVAKNHGSTHHQSSDSFLTTSAGINYDVYHAELETTWARTRKHNFGWDNFRLAGRYQFMDEDIGDDYTLTAGFALTKAWKEALRDISSFHHGRIEGELHAALGKQWLCEQFWYQRVWGVLGMGQANAGYPWLRADVHWARNWWDWHQVMVFAKTLWGFGHRRIHVHDFHGYGNVRHQSIDLGLCYKYYVEAIGADVSAAYAYRVYAKNFPARASNFVVSIRYPLGLQEVPYLNNLTRGLLPKQDD